MALNAELALVPLGPTGPTGALAARRAAKETGNVPGSVMGAMDV